MLLELSIHQIIVLLRNHPNSIVDYLVSLALVGHRVVLLILIDCGVSPQVGLLGDIPIGFNDLQ